MTPFNITMAACALAGPAAFAQEVDWKKVDDAFGRSGAVAGDVHRYGFPRTAAAAGVGHGEITGRVETAGSDGSALNTVINLFGSIS
jgi:hypothetical protein